MPKAVCFLDKEATQITRCVALKNTALGNHGVIVCVELLLAWGDLIFVNQTQSTYTWFIFTATTVPCNSMVYIYMSLMLDDSGIQYLYIIHRPPCDTNVM